MAVSPADPDPKALASRVRGGNHHDNLWLSVCPSTARPETRRGTGADSTVIYAGIKMDRAAANVLDIENEPTSARMFPTKLERLWNRPPDHPSNSW